MEDRKPTTGIPDLLFLQAPPCGKLCVSFSFWWKSHCSDMQRISYGNFPLKCHDVSEMSITVVIRDLPYLPADIQSVRADLDSGCCSHCRLPLSCWDALCCWKPGEKMLIHLHFVRGIDLGIWFLYTLLVFGFDFPSCSKIMNIQMSFGGIRREDIAGVG